MLKRIPKPILYTAIYYIVATLLGVYFNVSKDFKSGPCTIGLDIAWPFLVVLASVLLALVYFMRLALKKGRINLYVALIHLSVLIAFVVFLIVNSKSVH